MRIWRLLVGLLQSQRVARAAFAMALPLIFVIAMIPDQGGPDFAQSDKVMHALAFVVLTLLAYMGWPVRAAFIRCCILLLAYGASIEIAQAILPWREASFADWAADAVGMLLAVPPILWHERAVRARVCT